MIYDAIIAGGGPAGYSAALYLAMAGYSALVIERMTEGGQAALTDTIENYPGFDSGIGGFELGMRMKNGAERFGAESIYANISDIYPDGDIKRVIADGKEFSALALILATGASPRRLGLENEEALTGMGVHYCAHCDGRFYKDKTVAVVGGGNSAIEDCIYLSKLAKKVILIHRRDGFRASRYNQEKLTGKDNIEYRFNSRLTELIVDDGRLTKIEITDSSDKKEALPIDGVFVSIGRDPETSLVKDKLLLDERGYVIADETTRTSRDGVFAAGDLRTKPLRQVVTAASDGAVAAVMAEEYIEKINLKNRTSM